MTEYTGFATWQEKVTALRQVLAERPSRRDHRGPLKPIDAAVVQADGLATCVLARDSFLQVLIDVVPELLCDLAGEPLEAFEHHWMKLLSPFWPLKPGRPESVGLFDAWQQLTSECQPAIVRWCRRWGLDPWSTLGPEVFDHILQSPMLLRVRRFWPHSVAFGVLVRWWLGPVDEAAHAVGVAPYVMDDWYAQHWNRPLGLKQRIKLQRVFWDPQRETRASALARIETDLGVRIRAELDRIEADALKVGAKPALVKRTGLEHFAWLASYQCKSESYAQIARWACRERQTIADGVKQAAELIELPLRSST